MRWHRPAPDREPLGPRDILKSGMCIGCGSCAGQAGAQRARMSMDRYGQLKPFGSRQWLSTRSAAFSRTCPFSPRAANETEIAAARFPTAPHSDAAVGRYEAAYVGHASEADFRRSGSSGGMVSWIASELLRKGLVDGVAHVAPAAGDAPNQPLFRYVMSRSEAEVRAGAKSRYYPVELSGVIETIRDNPERYAVVGIPCFVKAVHLLCAEEPVLRERVVFTLGLFCGHMKSARMVESFAWQMDEGAETVAGIDYRAKDPRRPANWYTAELKLKDGGTKRRDWWHLVDGDWGAGFFQNSACNVCDDVIAETADISFGDAWVEPYASDGRGTNVVVVRSPALHDLVRDGIAGDRLSLEEVDSGFVERTQAAGLRHRREGLAFRLARRRDFVRASKRVAPASDGLPLRRKLIYRMRSHIGRWSDRVFLVARIVRQPRFYTSWARAELAIYQGLTYSRGWIGKLIDGLGLGSSRPAK